MNTQSRKRSSRKKLILRSRIHKKRSRRSRKKSSRSRSRKSELHWSEFSPLFQKCNETVKCKEMLNQRDEIVKKLHETISRLNVQNISSGLSPNKVRQNEEEISNCKSQIDQINKQAALQLNETQAIHVKELGKLNEEKNRILEQIKTDHNAELIHEKVELLKELTKQKTDHENALMDLKNMFTQTIQKEKMLTVQLKTQLEGQVIIDEQSKKEVTEKYLSQIAALNATLEQAKGDCKIKISESENRKEELEQKGTLCQLEIDKLKSLTLSNEDEKKLLQIRLNEVTAERDMFHNQLLNLQNVKENPKSTIIENLDKEIAFIMRQTVIFTKVKENLSKVKDDSLKKKITSFISNNEKLYVNSRKEAVKWESKHDNLKEIKTIYNGSLQLLKNDLMNMYEDAAGGVRVYSRIKPYLGGDSVVKKLNNKVRLNCNGKETDYGDFFGVVSSEFTNPDMYSGCDETEIDQGKITNDEKQCCDDSSTPGFCRVINQLQDGYNVILFGYGHSGSGKTYSLFGNPNVSNDPGLIQLAVANSGALFIKICNIFELQKTITVNLANKDAELGKITYHYKGDTLLDIGGFDVKSNINDHMTKFFNSVSSITTTSDKLKKEMNSFFTTRSIANLIQESNDKLYQESLPSSRSSVAYGGTKGDLINISKIANLRVFLTAFSTLIKDIDEYRLKMKTIKTTPNNPMSSRSHLFINLELKFENGNSGFLSICDLGGRESTRDILKQFIVSDEKIWSKNLPSIILGTNSNYTFKNFNQSDLPNFNKDEQAKYISKINDIVKPNANRNLLPPVLWEILKESIFINETLNQLEYFFTVTLFGNKNVKKIMNTKNGITEKSFDEKNFLYSIPTLENDKTGMFKLLSKLNSYYSEKNKFVMICNVRQEPAYCESTKATLEFADSIKST